MNWRRDEARVPRPCATCGRGTSSQPSNPAPECLDCARRRFGLDDSKWFTPIGEWHPTRRYGRYAVDRDESSTAPPASAYTVLRPAHPYDLATPGTPAGILAVARAAEAGGAWTHRATLALAVPAGGGADDVVASLALRLAAALPDRPRRAWVMYLRRADPVTGRSTWAPPSTGAVAAILDAATTPTVRPLGIEELKAILRGEVWTPPALREVFTVPCPGCGKPARLTGDGKIYASHRCEAEHVEGRS